MKKYDNNIEIKLYLLLIVGVGMLVYVITQLPHVFVFKSSLTAIHGTLQSANIDTKAKTDREGHRYETRELVFFLNESDKEFRVSANVVDPYKILKSLNRSISLTIWVKTSARDERSPKVFQIDRDGKYTLLAFNEVRDNQRPAMALLFVLGLALILFFVWMKYPEKLKKIFS